MTARINLDNIAIILAQPQIPENIRAVARAMNNMGLSRLSLVSPKNYELPRVSRMATGSSIEAEKMLCGQDKIIVQAPFPVPQYAA